MAAKGTQSKEAIYKTLEMLFPNAFWNGKEFRIPCQENGEVVEIKCALTAAKECVGAGTEGALGVVAPIAANGSIEFTEEELNKCREYLKELGLL